MASLIDTLIDVLGQEDAEYKKLLELSNNKTKAIVGADIERLQDILVQEQAQIDAINKLEQQRMENVDDICNVLNLRRTDIKLEDILEVLKKQPKEHDALAAVNAQLKKTLNELMKINENNKLLTKESLDMVIWLSLNLTLQKMQCLHHRQETTVKTLMTRRESRPSAALMQDSNI